MTDDSAVLDNLPLDFPLEISREKIPPNVSPAALGYWDIDEKKLKTGVSRWMAEVYLITRES